MLLAITGAINRTTAEILATVRTLRPQEQLFLIDSLFEMLDGPDPAINAASTGEAKDRLAAYDKGEIQVGPIEKLFAKLRAV